MDKSRESPCTIADLIAKLQRYPPEMRVMVNGYEGGMHDVGDLMKVQVNLNVNSRWYYGPHEVVTHDGDADCEAILIDNWG